MRDGKEIQIQIPMEVNATQIAQKPPTGTIPADRTIKETPRRIPGKRHYRACTSALSHHPVFTTRSIAQTQEFKRHPCMCRPKADQQINVAHTTGSSPHH